MSSARGRYIICWDWKQNKYIWVSREELRKEAANKDKTLEPSPYLQNCRPNKIRNQPAVKVPAKRGCKRPLEVYKQQAKHSLPTKNKRVPKPKSSAPKPKSSSKASQQPAKKSLRRRHRLPASTDMADKEMESKNSGDETDTCLPPHELLQGHGTFMSVMTNRLIHQGAALTFWRQSPNALISYLVRTNDDAVTVDILPVLTESFSGMKTASNESQISMGSCLDLIPTLRKLLDSKFEDYIKASLDFLRTMLRSYWKELQEMKAAQKVTNLQRSQSLYGIYTAVVAMTDKVNRLAKRKGSVGPKATIVAELIKQL